MARAPQKAVAVEEEDLDTSASNDSPAGGMFEDNEDGLVVHMEGVEAQKFELLPKQDFNCVIEDNTFSMSKSSNKPMWSLKLSILDDGDYHNRKLFPNLSFSEKALPGTKAALATFAPELADTSFKVNDPEIVAGMIGRKVKVRVGIEKSEGYDERNVVKRWKPADGSFIA